MSVSTVQPEAGESSVENLKFSADFPGSWSLLNIPKTAVSTINLKIYQSLGKKRFAYKRDIYATLQSCIEDAPMKPLEAEVATSMIAYCLKVQEEKVNASEMTEFDPTLFATVKMDMAQAKSSFIGGSWQSLTPRKIRFDEITLEEAAEAFIEYMYDVATHEAQEGILELLKKFSEKVPMKYNALAYLKIYTWVSMICWYFGKLNYCNTDIIKSESDDFEPFQYPKAIVRMFNSNEDNLKILMVHELYQRMKMMELDVSGLEKMAHEMSDVGTITFRQVFEIVPRDVMKNIEFVCVDVNTLIPLIDGGYCTMENGEMVKYLKESEEPKQDEKDEVMESDEQTPVTSDDEVSDAAVEDVVEEKEEQKQLEKPRKKKVRAPRKKVVIQTQAPKPEAKESDTCQKCFRASQHTRASNEKLRLEKIEKKALIKKVVELELEQMNKEEKMMQMIERLQKEKEEALRIQRQQLEEENRKEKEEILNVHKEQIEELRKQLDIKDEMIEDLHAAVSFAPQPVPGVTPEVISEETAPTRLNEETRTVLFSLLELRETFRKESPISKVLQMTNRLMAKTNNVEVRRRSRFEAIFYRQACTKYIEAVESNLVMIRANQQIAADQIPKLPVFPTLSQWFKDAYKETMKVDAPSICESLIKAPEVNPDELVDKECLICLEHMGSDEETTKCECCKRRYHGECIKEWFKTKRMCPTCNSGMLDSNEFPTLS